MRGITALKGAGVGSRVFDTLIPMQGRMIHPPAASPDAAAAKWTTIPYGNYGEVCCCWVLPLLGVCGCFDVDTTDLLVAVV